MKSNDSPEIPDRGETSDIPGLPSGGVCSVRMLSGMCSVRMLSGVCSVRML